MIRAERLTLTERPVDVSAPGPSATQVVALRNASDEADSPPATRAAVVLAAGEPPAKGDEQTGYRLRPGEAIGGFELGTNQHLYLWAPGAPEGGVPVDVLIEGAG